MFKVYYDTNSKRLTRITEVDEENNEKMQLLYLNSQTEDFAEINLSDLDLEEIASKFLIKKVVGNQIVNMEGEEKRLIVEEKWKKLLERSLEILKYIDDQISYLSTVVSIDPLIKDKINDLTAQREATINRINENKSNLLQKFGLESL